MTTQERIKELCRQHGIAVTALEKELGFSNGSLSKKSEIKTERLSKVAEYFGVSEQYLRYGEVSQGYYYDEETAKLAQAYYENRDLRMLFDAARDAKPEDIRLSYDMLMALKRKEKHEED